MKFASVIVTLFLSCLFGFASERTPSSVPKPGMHGSSELLLPDNYRSWIELSPSTPGLPSPRHKQLANKLYVEPAAYEHFNQTGVWPNKTVIVLEMRTGKPVPKGQCDVMGLEAAVKDDTHFPDQWSYYGIMYDQPKVASAKVPEKVCGDCDEQLDLMLAVNFPTLRAVINAKPASVKPSTL